MKRLFIICLLFFLQIKIPLTFAEDANVSLYIQENRDLRKSLIDLKHDFYSFKIAQAKSEEMQAQSVGSGYSWLFVTMLCLSLFLIWQVARNLRVPLKQLSDQKMGKFLQNQLDIFSEMEQKIRVSQVNQAEQSTKFLEGFLLSLEEMLRKDPKNDKHLYEKAEVEAYLGRKVSALQDLREAVMLNTKWKETAKNSACFQKISNFVEFKKIVAEEPTV